MFERPVFERGIVFVDAAELNLWIVVLAMAFNVRVFYCLWTAGLVVTRVVTFVANFDYHSGIDQSGRNPVVQSFQESEAHPPPSISGRECLHLLLDIVAGFFRHRLNAVARRRMRDGFAS